MSSFPGKLFFAMAEDDRDRKRYEANKCCRLMSAPLLLKELCPGFKIYLVLKLSLPWGEPKPIFNLCLRCVCRL